MLFLHPHSKAAEKRKKAQPEEAHDKIKTIFWIWTIDIYRCKYGSSKRKKKKEGWLACCCRSQELWPGKMWNERFAYVGGVRKQ